MKTCSILLFSLFVAFSLESQTCEVDNLIFSSQSQIDDFPNSSNGCRVIVGNISINEGPGERITNLAGLSNIESIRGNFEIRYTRGLKHLNDLVDLDSIYGKFDLADNDSLFSIAGVNGLKFVGGRIYIIRNSYLIELGEFDSIDSLNELQLYIPEITEFNAFPNLQKVDHLLLGKNKSKDLSGFSSLKQVNYLAILNGDSLVSLHGLENITVLKGLHLKDNPLLTNLVGLGPLDTLYYGIGIENNQSLTSLDLLENTFSNSLSYVQIKNNPNIHYCHYNFICEALAKVNVEYEIDNNAIGCQTFYDVAKNCNLDCPGNISFANQEEIDNFPTIFPNCTFVPGRMDIWYTDVTNLDSLYRLTGIGEYLIIRRSPIKSLYGLRNIDTIGQGLEIQDCDSLNNLNGLEGMTKIPMLTLDDIPKLSDMSGISNLMEVGGLSLYDLPIINSFNNLKTVGGLYVRGDEVDLVEFNFPPQLDTVYGEMVISGIDSLEIFPDAPNLKYSGGFALGRTSFKSLEGLSGLETVNGDLVINDNPFLQTLDGIRNVRTVNGGLAIDRNESLTSIEALSYIDPDSLETYLDFPLISISENLSLSNCAIEPVCSLLSDNDDLILIEGNGTSCFNREEVLDACIVKTYDTSQEAFSIFPNPSRGEIAIRFEDNSNMYINQVMIYNQTGSLVEIVKFNSTINLSHLVDGLYNLVFLMGDNKIFSTRIVMTR